MPGEAPLKTVENDADVAAFIAALPDPLRREQSILMDLLHREVTGLAPRMWGPSIIGYGQYHYTLANGKIGVMARAGFSPRKAAMTLYLMGNYCDHQAEADALFARLGPHSTGKSCLYIKRFDAIDKCALHALVTLSWDIMNRIYPD